MHYGVAFCPFYENMGWPSNILIKSLRRLALFIIVSMALKKSYFWWVCYDLKSSSKAVQSLVWDDQALNKKLDLLLKIYDINIAHSETFKSRYIKSPIFTVKQIWSNCLCIDDASGDKFQSETLLKVIYNEIKVISYHLRFSDLPKRKNQPFYVFMFQNTEICLC